MNEWLDELNSNVENAYAMAQCLMPRHESVPSDPQDIMDTFGNLIDKLVTVNLKMWHNQEVLYEIRRMTPTEFEERWSENMDELREVIGRCCDLNVQRSGLMDEIDKFLHGVMTGEIDVKSLVRRQHKTY